MADTAAWRKACKTWEDIRDLARAAGDASRVANAEVSIKACEARIATAEGQLAQIEARLLTLDTSPQQE